MSGNARLTCGSISYSHSYLVLELLLLTDLVDKEIAFEPLEEKDETEHEEEEEEKNFKEQDENTDEEEEELKEDEVEPEKINSVSMHTHASY